MSGKGSALSDAELDALNGRTAAIDADFLAKGFDRKYTVANSYRYLTQGVALDAPLAARARAANTEDAGHLAIRRERLQASAAGRDGTDAEQAQNQKFLRRRDARVRLGVHDDRPPNHRCPIALHGRPCSPGTPGASPLRIWMGGRHPGDRRNSSVPASAKRTQSVLRRQSHPNRHVRLKKRWPHGQRFNPHFRLFSNQFRNRSSNSIPSPRGW